MDAQTTQDQAEQIMKKGRIAAFSACKLFGLHGATPTDLDDMIQTAAFTFWRLTEEGKSPAYAFVAAREEARQCYVEQLLGRNPRNPVRLDISLTDDDDPPLERLATRTDEEPVPRLSWLSDEVLEGVLFEARQAADYPQRCLTRFWDTIQADKLIIRLAANGHTNASIAELMGTTEGTIRNRRQRIRRLLESLLPLDAVPVEYSRTGGNQQRAREIQLTYPRARRPKSA